ncbi:hypothetical protein HZA43_00965 [Candidatus Peregrinibacteria bacterium]|nr:hypothetical protein [Candidatus Peregrinibacteria bacterium]
MQCIQCKTPFEISQREIDFCKKIDMSLPTLCPQDRWRELMASRNEWKLYRRKCDATGKEILSAYAPDSPFKVYNNPVWWGGTWDAVEYGRDFDFSRPFFGQFAELQKVVPREGTSIFNSENCDYNSHIRQSRNCYLNSLVAKCEETLYSYWMVEDKDVADCMYTNYSTLCYECTDINNGYNCVMLQESDNCSDCYFSYQLKGCNHCIFSSNLANKSYYCFNKPCAKEQFEEIKNRLLNGSYSRWQEAEKRFQEMRLAAKRRYVHMLNTENCTGDHLYNSRNCENCFDSHDAEDCANSISLGAAKDIYNCYSAGWPDTQMSYYCCVSRGSLDLAFCTYTWFSNKMRYCNSCISSENCFGSISLQHKKYCILNKQYTKEEYEKQVVRVIEHMKKTGEWGQFFPASASPFAYNETAAQDFFPLAKADALKLGYRWRDQDKKEYQSPTLAKIPDSLNDVSDGILAEILACATCKKNYRLIAQELALYRKMKLPLPRLCPSCRHKKRFSMRNPYQLFTRPCQNCQKPILTTYSPDRPEIVYCEACYLKEVH